MSRGKEKSRDRILPKFLEEGQLKAMQDQVNIGNPTGIRNMIALELMAWSGLRVSEVSALRLGDIDWNAKAPSVTVLGKGNKERVVGLRDRTMHWMRQWRAIRRPRAATFLHTIKGGAAKPCSRSSMLKMVKRYASLAGLDPATVGCHVLRHTAATRLMRGGMDLPTLQEHLGHADVGTTRVYTHVVPARRIEDFRRMTNDQATLDDAPTEVDRALQALPEDVKRAALEDAMTRMQQALDAMDDD